MPPAISQPSFAAEFPPWPVIPSSRTSCSARAPGQGALQALFQACPRNHRRRQARPARSRPQPAPARGHHRGPARRTCPRTISSARSRRPAAATPRIIDEVRYEGYGPGGVALIVEALTDNRNRTVGRRPRGFFQIWRGAGRDQFRRISCSTMSARSPIRKTRAATMRCWKPRIEVGRRGMRLRRRRPRILAPASKISAPCAMRWKRNSAPRIGRDHLAGAEQYRGERRGRAKPWSSCSTCSTTMTTCSASTAITNCRMR